MKCRKVRSLLKQHYAEGKRPGEDDQQREERKRDREREKESEREGEGEGGGGKAQVVRL